MQVCSDIWVFACYAIIKGGGHGKFYSKFIVQIISIKTHDIILKFLKFVKLVK